MDLFLFDVKESDPELHRQFTGVSNQLLVENLRALDRLGSRSILRCPIIPGYNDRPEHFRGIAELANGLENVLEINLLPYHSLGASKSQRLGKDNPLDGVAMPSEAQAQEWLAQVQQHTRLPVRKD